MWLKARLVAAGQRPISNVVDITNYAMLLTGQPLHAFDLDRIAGRRLVVRRAGEGEQVVTLDGQTRVLDPDVVLIADDDGPTSIAGVMGGTRSEVQPDTTRVLMEVASWDGPNIHATSTKLGLRSEASARFEKGLSVEQAMEAQIVATKLMLELTGARLVPGTIDVGGAGPQPVVLRLRDARVSGLLGVEIDRSESALHLSRLGFETAEREDTRSPAARRAQADWTSRSRTGAATTSPARPTSSRRSRGCTASTTSCPPRCRAAAAPPASSRPPSARAAAPRTRSPAVACSRSSAGASRPPSSTTACGCRPTTRAARASSSRTR